MSFLTTMAMASSSASTASSASSVVTAPAFVVSGGWGRIGFHSTRVAAEDGDDEAMNKPTTTNCEVSATTSLSTSSYSSRRHFYGGDGGVEENAVSDDDDDDEEDIDSEDEDSSLEELQPRGGSTVMGIQAWPGRRSLYEDFAGADTTDDGKDEEDDGMDRLAASHMLLSTVFRHGGDGGGGGNHNQSNSVVRVVSSDDDDDDNLKEVEDNDDEAALAEQWERQLRQNYQKEQQWQRLLAAMGDSANGNGNGKGLDLSTIVEEEDDDGSTADHFDCAFQDDVAPCCSHPTSRNDERRGVFEGDDLLDLDNERLRWIEADSGAEKSSAWNMASERDDCEEYGGVGPCTDRSTGLMTRTTHRIDSEPQQQKAEREPLWLQLPGILPRIHSGPSDPHGLAVGAAAQGDVGARPTFQANERGPPPPPPPGELLQKTLECIAALAFYG